MSQISFRENGSFPIDSEGEVGDISTGILHQGKRMIGVKYPDGWIYSFLDNDIKTVAKNIKLTTKKKVPKFATTGTGGAGGQNNVGENVGSGTGWYKGMDGSNLQFKTIKTNSGSYQLQIASNSNDLTITQHTDLVSDIGGKMEDVVDDGSPDLGGTLNCNEHPIVFKRTSETAATASVANGSAGAFFYFEKGNKFDLTLDTTLLNFYIDYDNITTIKNGNFNAVIRCIQDGAGGYGVTNWYVIGATRTLKWQGGVAPTFTTGSGKVDIITLYCDGVNVYGTVLKNF